MFKLVPTLPLGGASRDGKGFSIKEAYMGELVSVAFDVDNQKTFATKFKKVFGTRLPAPNQMVETADGLAFWSGPGQVMLLQDGENIHADSETAKKLDGLAYTTLQSDAWVSVNIEGDSVLDVLERFIPLDLRAAPEHFAARTNGHHMAVIILKFSDSEFKLLSPRSSARSFYDALSHTADNVLCREH